MRLFLSVHLTGQWAHEGSYYDQQRKNLLAKHGIDLDDGVATVRPPRRSSNAALLSDQERRGNLLTIRDRDRKKLAYSVVVRPRSQRAR